MAIMNIQMGMRSTEMNDDLLNKHFYELLKDVSGRDEQGMLEWMTEHTFFIAPEDIFKCTVVFPEFVRTSKEHFKGKLKGDTATLANGDVVRITDNTKAREAFGWYTGKIMGGNGRTVAKGWDVTHIWGTVYDPQFFTAGWNICLMPNFLRQLTEEQANLPAFQNVLKQISWDYYLSQPPLEELRQMYPQLKDPGMELSKKFPGWSPSFLKKKKLAA